jgi:hypothetical protein
MTDHLTISHLEHGPMMYGSGWSAHVETDAHRLGVSRYDDEQVWTVDSLIVLANGYPVWVNGQGSRCALSSPVNDVVQAALDAEVRDRFCAECGEPVVHDAVSMVGYDAAFRSDGAVVHGRCLDPERA